MLVEILENLSNFFMLFVPGYIFLLKRKSLYAYKKSDDIDLIVKSIGVSALIRLLGGLLLSFNKFNVINNNIFIKKYTNEILILYYIAFAYGLFYLVSYIEYVFDKKYKAKLIKHFEIKDSFAKHIFSNLLYRENKPNVWNKIFSEALNKQVRVYIKDSKVVYMGFIKHYTIDPEEKIKEICLNRYSIVEKNENWQESGELYIEKDCFFDDKTSYAYLVLDNIERIEIINTI